MVLLMVPRVSLNQVCHHLIQAAAELIRACGPVRITFRAAKGAVAGNNVLLNPNNLARLIFQLPFRGAGQ